MEPHAQHKLAAAATLDAKQDQDGGWPRPQAALPQGWQPYQQQQPQGLPAGSSTQQQQQHALPDVPEQPHAQPPLPPVGRRVEPLMQYQRQRPTGELPMHELLCCPLWSVPRPVPVCQERESRFFPHYPAAVTSRPDYFRTEMMNYLAQQAGQQQQVGQAPDYRDRNKYANVPATEMKVVSFLEPVTTALHDILNSQGRCDRYEPVHKTGESCSADVPVPAIGSGMSDISPAAAAASAAVTAAPATAEMPEVVTRPVSAAAPIALVEDMEAGSSRDVGPTDYTVVRHNSRGSNRNSRGSSSRRAADLVLLESKYDFDDNPVTTVPAIFGSQTLQGYLAKYPELQPEQQQQPGSSEQGVLQQQQLGPRQQTTVHIPAVQDRPILVVEIKKAEKLLDVNGQPLQLAELYHAGDRHVKSLFGQVLTYLVKYKVRIAVLTCHEVLWVVERHDAALDTLFISEPIPAANKGPRQLTQLLAMAWAQHKAILQLAVPLAEVPLDSSERGWSPCDDSGTGRGSNRDDVERSSGDRSRREVKKARNDDYWYGSDMSGLCGSHVSREAATDAGSSYDLLPCQVRHYHHHQQQQQRISVRQQLRALARLEASLPTVPNSALELHPGARVLGRGRTAVVYKGSFGGRDAAIKVFSWQTPAMVREVCMYHRVRQVQGVVVPQVLGFGKLAAAREGFSFLALSLVPGTPLSAIRLTPNIAAAAVSAVQQLHSCGVVHGDLTRGNMLLLHQPPSSSSNNSAGLQHQSKVMVVDLEDALLASAQECSEELQCLQSKLAAAMRHQ